MSAMASQINSLMIVYSTVYSGADQRQHQSFASLAFVWEIKRWPVNSPHKGPVTRKMFPFDDIIMMSVNCNGSEGYIDGLVRDCSISSALAMEIFSLALSYLHMYGYGSNTWKHHSTHSALCAPETVVHQCSCISSSLSVSIRKWKNSIKILH